MWKTCNSWSPSGEGEQILVCSPTRIPGGREGEFYFYHHLHIYHDPWSRMLLSEHLTCNSSIIPAIILISQGCLSSMLSCLRVIKSLKMKKNQLPRTDEQKQQNWWLLCMRQCIFCLPFTLSALHYLQINWASVTTYYCYHLPGNFFSHPSPTYNSCYS